jgi:hypothetical protein
MYYLSRGCGTGSTVAKPLVRIILPIQVKYYLFGGYRVGGRQSGGGETPLSVHIIKNKISYENKFIRLSPADWNK